MDWTERIVSAVIAALVGGGIAFGIMEFWVDGPPWPAVGGGAALFGVLGFLFGKRFIEALWEWQDWV